jgi:capsular polysaccharide biosynthesis protein
MFAAGYRAALPGSWRLVGVLSVLTALIAGLLAWAQPPTYRAQLRLIVSFHGAAGGPPGAVPGDSDTARRLSESRVRSYTRGATSAAVLRAVIRSLRLSRSAGDLAAEIDAWTPLDTTYIDISVRDDNAERALRIGNAIAAELIRLAEAEKPPPPPVPVLSIAVAAPPSVPDGPARPFWPGYAAGGAVAGFAMGLGLALLWTARRRLSAQGSDAHAIGSGQ